jgi:hypothetical protein
MLRRGFGVFLVPLCLAAAALVAFAGTTGASAAKAPRRVALKVNVTGSGTVRVAGSRALTCHVAACRYTVHVRRGRRIVIEALPLTGWKLTKWAGACKGSGAKCSLKLKARRSVAVRFVPPGDRLNPYALGTAVTLSGTNSGSVRVNVNTAIMNASSQVSPPPPAGRQYTLVNLTMRNMGPGSATLRSFLASPGQMWTEAHGNTIYPPDGCRPPQPDLGSGGSLSPGQSMTGNLCYEIHSDDAGTLLLSGQALKGKAERTVWFALR